MSETSRLVEIACPTCGAILLVDYRRVDTPPVQTIDISFRLGGCPCEWTDEQFDEAVRRAGNGVVMDSKEGQGGPTD